MKCPLFIPRARREARDAVSNAARMIVCKPGLGRVRLDPAPERYRFRSLRGFPYLSVYDAVSDPPVVVRFIHQARDLPGASE